jgi:hypothetical protein
MVFWIEIGASEIYGLTSTQQKSAGEETKNILSWKEIEMNDRRSTQLTWWIRAKVSCWCEEKEQVRIEACGKRL